MKLPQLPAHPDCRACGLGDPDLVNHIGLPSRIWNGGPGKPRPRRALLLIGSHPGVGEDRDGVIFSGATGDYTNDTYIAGAYLHELADCYLANTVRCCPRDAETVSLGMMRACRTHLEADVQELARHYKEVVLLLMGERAVTDVVGTTAIRTFPQGSKVTFAGVRCTVFATNLAAVLLPGRDPSKILAVREHLLLVHRYLLEGRLATKVRVPRKVEDLCGPWVGDPPANAGILTLDIETYGFIRGQPDQTVFHPMKSMDIDGVPREDLVGTVALAWRDPPTGQLRVKVYAVQNPEDLERLVQVLDRVENLVILNQNVVFDVLYLWSFDERFRRILHPNRCTLYELSAVNFLENDQRLERSLKTVAMTQGVANYLPEMESKKQAGKPYRGWFDHKLFRYNAKDVLATLLTYETFLEGIRVRYPATTERWTPQSRKWFNDLVWLCVQMEWNGIRHDRAELQKTHDLLLQKMTRLKQVAKARWDFPLEEKGAGKAKDREFIRLFNKWTPGTRSPEKRTRFIERIGFTKTGKLCVDVENLNLLLGVVRTGCDDRRMLTCFRYFKKWQKIVTTYTGPLLGLGKTEKARKKRISTKITGDIAYPRWFPVPTQLDRSDREFGGTQQCRITSKDPAVQTNPPPVERCQRSRYRDGVLLRADSSQLELRVATMWSADTEFLRIFQTPGANVHRETAQSVVDLLGLKLKVTKDDQPKWYHTGKTLNFLMLFLGGWRKLQETVLREADFYLPDAQCQRIVEGFSRLHQKQRAWQEANVEKARQQGYLELPISGLSRSFLGDIDASYVPMIANLPVQALAAMLIQSSQFAIEDLIQHRKRTKVLTVGNVYDEGVWDLPRSEVPWLAKAAIRLFRRPPILETLIRDHPLVEVPLDVAATITYNDGTTLKLDPREYV